MLHSIQMKDFMSKDPVTFGPETAIYDAVHTLLQNKITGATVLNEDGSLAGVVSEMDLLKALEEISYYNQGDGRVGDYMNTDVVVIDEDMNIYDVANRLLELKIRRLPVVEDGKFVGQISCRSILQAMKDSMCQHDDTEDDQFE